MALSEQVLHLEEGWNYVSLNVIPDNLNFSAIFASVLDDILLAKNGAGAIFAPEYGIDTLSPFDPLQGYKIKAKRAVDVVIVGTRIDVGSSPLVLQTGWNLLPFTAAKNQAVTDALSTILAHVVRIEDGDGRFYVAGENNGNLDTLTVGYSYNVYVDQPATLTYPSDTVDPPPPPLPAGGGLEVNSFSDAMALEGLQVGDTLNVLGYYEAGDGGGGLFVIDDSACATDGGTCFGFDEDLSTEQNELFRAFHLLTPLGHENIAFGSLTLELITSSGQSISEISDIQLHGHKASDRYTLRSVVNHGRGIINQAKAPYSFMGGEGQFRFRYRYYESNRRLVRRDIDDVLYVDWFGARTYSDDPTFDNQPIINWTVNAANARGSIKTVKFQKAAVYEYFGSIELSDGLILEGAGGTELVTAVDDLGNTYRPVRVKNEHTRLRVKSGEALKHLRMIYLDSANPNYLPSDQKRILETRRSVIRPVSGAMTCGLRNLVLDGNWEGNREPFQNRDAYGGYDAFETELRNSPGWAGFVANSHGGVAVPVGQQLTVNNVAIIGYGSNGILGMSNNEWYGENVLLGNSVWNHVWYNAGGTWRNLTFTGFAWGHGAPSWGTVENLVYEKGAVGPYRPSDGLIGIRVPDIYDSSETAESRYVRTDGSSIPLGFTVDGFYFDGRGGQLQYPFGGIGPNVVLKNGVLIENGQRKGALYVESSNGYQKALYPNNLIENVKVYQIGPNKGHLFGKLNVTQSTFRNIDVIDVDNVPPKGRYVMKMTAGRRDHPAWDSPQSIVLDEIHDTSSSEFILVTGVAENASGRDIYIQNSSFNNRSNKVVVGTNWSGALSDFGGDPSKLRLLLDNVELNIGIDRYWSSLELLFTIGYFHNVTAVNSGRVSEDGGTYVYTAVGGESIVDIPTNLFWVPEFYNVSGPAGSPGLVSNVNVIFPTSTSSGPYKTEPSLRVNLNRSLATGESIAFDWSAAVRPFPTN